MAGTYGGVPDSEDTGGSSSTNAGAPFGSFDDLNEYGVSPSIADQKIIWKKNPPKPVMATDAKTGKEVQGMTSDASGVRKLETNMNEELSYAESVRYLYGIDSEKVGDLQLRLAAGGWFGKNPNFVPRTPDSKTRTVWDNVLKTSMRTNKTPDEIIQESIDAEGGLEEGLKKHNVDGSAATQPKSVLVTHPDDIRRIAKEISTKTLGRGWNNEQLDKFVTAYQAMDRASGEAEGTRAAAPSVEAAAEAAARRDNPLQAQAMDANNVMSMVIKSFGILGGSGEE